MGGKLKNMTAKRRKEARQKPDLGKAIVAGVKDRPSKHVSAAKVEDTEKPALQDFVTERTTDDATVYTDESCSYIGLPREHDTVKHSAGEYAKGEASTNGMESFWSLFKRGYHGTFHHLSEKHLDRYVREFTGRNNIRDLDTIDQMTTLARGLVGKRLSYRDLVAGLK